MKFIVRLVKYARRYSIYLWLTGISTLVITALNLVAPWIIRSLMNRLGGEGTLNIAALGWLALSLTGIYLLRVVFRFMASYLSHVASWNLVSDMRVRVYDHLQRLSLRYYQDKQTGQLMSRTVNDTSTFESLIAHSIPDAASNILVVVGVMTILLILNPTLALLTLIPVPFIFFGTIFYSKKVRPAFRKAQQALSELNADLQDNLSGIREIQVFNQQNREAEKIEKRARAHSRSTLRALYLSGIFHPIIEFFTSLGTVIVVFFGGILSMHGHLPTGDIVAYFLYLSLFYQPITVLARMMEDIQSAYAGGERVFEVLDAVSEITEKADATVMPRTSGHIRFDHVTFRYEDSVPVLEDVSFEASAGSMLAVVGPTGVGKTTIISLIARFYDPVSGSITLDGTDLRDVTLHSLRDQISIVLQDVFLFNGTIEENIGYSCQGASREDILQAAKIAHAHDFIMGTPHGYDTMIGERGMRLSGGQKQRLAIARAVLKNSPILILDEATSAVDMETERDIQNAIEELAETRTIIVIAHRLSTVQRADKILVLDNGGIAESGTHDELIQLENGIYHRLTSIQLNHSALQ